MSSFVDPDEQAAKEAEEERKKTGTPEPNPPKQETIFSYLERIATAVEENTKALVSLIDVKEKLAFDVKVAEVKKTVETKVAETPKVIPETKPEQPKNVEKPQQTTGSNNDIQNVKNAFSAELANLLIFEKEDDYIKIRTKAYLTGDSFPKIAAIVRELGGEYISAGKNTHFRVKKTA